MYAMSDYKRSHHSLESPLVSGLIIAGTDDGLIHVTEDAGNNWRKVEVGSVWRSRSAASTIFALIYMMRTPS